MLNIYMESDYPEIKLMCNFSIVLYRSIWQILSPFQRMLLNFCIYFHSFICTTCIFHFLESNLHFFSVKNIQSVIFSKRMGIYLTLVFIDLKILPSFLPFLTFSFFLTFDTSPHNLSAVWDLSKDEVVWQTRSQIQLSLLRISGGLQHWVLTPRMFSSSIN